MSVVDILALAAGPIHVVDGAKTTAVKGILDTLDGSSVAVVHQLFPITPQAAVHVPTGHDALERQSRDDDG